MSYPLDLTVTGKPTPRTTERLGSSRQPQRPLSANRARSLKSNIFGGAEGEGREESRPTTRVKSAPVKKDREEKAAQGSYQGASIISKSELEAVKSIASTKDEEISDELDRPEVPEGIPKLQLGNLVDRDNKLKKPVQGYATSVETPNSASSVSWGTPIRSGRPPSGKKATAAKGGGWQMKQSRPLIPGNSPKPKKHEDVPSLDLQLSKSNEGLRELAKVAKQVRQDIKIEYMGTPKNKQQSNEEVISDGFNQPAVGPVGEEKGRKIENNGAASLQLNKLGESKKKQFIEETLLVDQLSRATIAAKSAESTQSPERLDSRQKRHRDLFASSSPITGSTTDTSLLKRLRFGARILTRNGHDALREINGFFFPSDQTITMYEFRQFGTRSNALPFIQRGTYVHLKGPKRGRQFSLLDINLGEDLHFVTENQSSLPDSLKTKPTITFRIAEFDVEARGKLLFDGCRTAKDRSERESWITNHDSSEEKQQRELIMVLRGNLQERLKKRAVKTVTNLSKYFRKMDKSGDGLLNKDELRAALHEFRLELPEESFDIIWQLLDTNDDGKLDYGEFIRGILGEMSENRKALVRKAFVRLDTTKTGWTTKDNLNKFFCASKHPKVVSGETTENELRTQFLSNFEETEKKGDVSYTEFEDFYEGLSIQTETDKEFSTIMRSSWGV